MNHQQRISNVMPDAWFGPWEGPYSLAQKFCWAALPSPKVLRDMFGMPYSGYRASANYSQLLVPRDGLVIWADRFLSRAAGQWAAALAKVDAFRYCPVCLRHGYQSSAYQMECLRCCPVHRCEILSACQYCGAATGPYALVYDAFNSPFCCRHCGRLLCGDIDLALWAQPEEFHERCQNALAPLYRWLGRS